MHFAGLNASPTQVCRHIADGMAVDVTYEIKDVGGRHACVLYKRPLSSNTRNKRLRMALHTAVIPVDVGVRYTKMYHMSRYGYAMPPTHNFGKRDSELKTLMRHRGLKFTEVYQRPTTNDVWRM